MHVVIISFDLVCLQRVEHAYNVKTVFLCAMLDSKGPMIENKTKTNTTIAKFEIVSQIGVTEIEDSTLNQFRCILYIYYN